MVLFVVIVLGLIPLAIIVSLFSRQRGDANHRVAMMKWRINGFNRLGKLAGRTDQEIIAHVGKPTSISAASGGQQLYQWMDTTHAGALHVALLFKDGVCLGVTHEHFH